MKQTDNGNEEAKLTLRRRFLDLYHRDSPIHVIDCCQGNGVMWKTLRAEYPVATYWGLDMKPKAGRMKVDSARLLATPGWVANLIDIDTYGNPWTHWEALLPNVSGPLTVIMTWGQLAFSPVEGGSLRSLGIGFDLPTSLGFGRSLCPLAMRARVYEAELRGLRVVDAVKVEGARGITHYFGVRLEPKWREEQP